MKISYDELFAKTAAVEGDTQNYLDQFKEMKDKEASGYRYTKI